MQCWFPPAIDTVTNNQDSTFYNISVPSVKLYDDVVKFSSNISPVPASGTIAIDFPNGDTLSTFPGVVQMRVKTSGTVTAGAYAITITGTGPNGTPVHKRTVTLTVTPIKTLNLTALIEGFFNSTTMVSDTITVELRNVVSPYTLLESKKVFLNTSGFGSASFPTVPDGATFYVVLKHRNSIDTWSAIGKSFTSGLLTYDFTSAQTQSFGNNLKLKNTKWCFIQRRNSEWRSIY